MSVAVTHQRLAGASSSVQFTSLNDIRTTGLMYTAALAAGVSIRVDAADPTRWHSITVTSWDEAARPVLEALIGSDVVAELDAQLVAETAESYEESIEIQWGGRFQEAAIRRSAQPWLRVGASEALNQWLHLPLRQVLIDAERAVVRWEAARGLQAGRARDQMLGDALVLARAVSWDLAAYFRQLWTRLRPMTDDLRVGLGRLVAGYESLLREVRTRADDDDDLQSVVTMARGLLDRFAVGASPGESIALRPAGEIPAARAEYGLDQSPGFGFSSLIDPSRVPARLLALGRDPEQAEIALRAVRIDDLDAVEVVVPAFHAFSSDITGAGHAERLLVRLVDRRTDQELQAGLLTYEPPGPEHQQISNPPLGGLFRGILPAPGLDLATVRAEVFHSDMLELSAPADDPADLLQVRTAVRQLARVRHLMAVALLVRGHEGRHQDRQGQVRAAQEEIVPPATSDRVRVEGAARLLVAELEAVDRDQD